MRATVMERLRAAFKPEFLNRIDDIILFRRLGIEQLRSIIRIQLEALRALLADRKVTLLIDSSAEDLIAREGYDPVYGARPLRRAIQSLIQNPLALQLLNGEIVAGDSVRVLGDLETGRMRFVKEGRGDVAAAGEGNR